MFVFNDAVHDRRVLLEADALQKAGWTVTVHACASAGVAHADVESRDSGVKIVRHRGDSLALNQRGSLLPKVMLRIAWSALSLSSQIARRVAPAWGRRLAAARRLVAWATQAAAGASDQGYLHAHDLTGGLPALLARSKRHQLVYDSHEIFLETAGMASVPRLLRKAAATFLEKPLIARADAFITVNFAVQEELGRRYRLPRHQLVLFNCAERIAPGTSADSPLRSAIGVGPETVVVLYHGGLTAVRGIPQLLQASRDPRLASVHFAFMGYGEMTEEIKGVASTDPRIHYVPAVSPDELVTWISSANVSVMLNRAESLNELCSTPNKLFEAIAAEVPVISSDFPERRRIVLDGDGGALGVVCDPDNIDSIVDAIVETTMSGPEYDRALRKRIRHAASTRWNWASESRKLVELYRILSAS